MDLKKLFGHKYEISLDPSWDAETPENRVEFLTQGEQWWYYEIRGKCGTIYPFSATTIAVTLPTRAARRLMKLMGSELTRTQHADDAMTFKTDAKHTAALVRFVRPKCLHSLSETHKAALVSRLAVCRDKRWRKTAVGWQESEASGALSHNAPILPPHPQTEITVSHPTERTLP